ncbi:CRP-like cAMP-binding protein [Dyadobacter jejuensis]|uniref:CRP-like cAMP-binding protein n=1 Tax=Dyadobacter jejuensis TaxID=1082580 RepID=A0A316ANF8_9BACT|nr:Crp/Fnr family transcriptional regulator [Dyadobacter jejuensis]PWJ58320.1 CRP-like cAMP-binding protein [Dyadobacter jejuensis]
MNPHEIIKSYIQRYIEITEEEADYFASCFETARFKKRQYIVQPGFTAKYRNYVLEGAFRSFVVGDQGQESTIEFAIDDWWITDYNSYIFQQPASMFVMALEDSLVLRIDFHKEQELKNANHHFESFFRIIAERALAAHQRRLISNLTLTAEERFTHFETNFPKFMGRVPQYALASFLGMTTEFLSRIRKRRLHNKS